MSKTPVSVYDRRKKLRRDDRSGGSMLQWRTLYTKAQREALNDLACSAPTMEEYVRKKAEILKRE